MNTWSVKTVGILVKIVLTPQISLKISFVTVCFYDG